MLKYRMRRMVIPREDILEFERVRKINEKNKLQFFNKINGECFKLFKIEFLPVQEK
jgi:hypothetical protein